MKFRNTHILLGVALALILFTYFYEIRGGKKREEAKAKETKVFDVKDADINWIEIGHSGAETIRVERVGSGDEKTWRLVKPLETRADDGAVGSITWQLADLSFSQVVQENPTDLAGFGLSSPELRVNFGTGEGAAKKTWAIEFGKNLPVGDNAYAMASGQKRVLLVGKSARSTFDKQAVDLRDKKVVSFKEDKLTSLEISTPELSVVLEKTGDKWKIASPMKAEADPDVVSKILEDLRSLEAKEFIPSVVANSLGLSTAEMTITLVTGADRRARQTVQFFRGKDAETAYAHPEGDAWFYKIAPEILKNIPRPAEEMRLRKVLVFERWDVEQVRLKPEGKPEMLLAKNETGDWEFVEPKDIKQKVVGSKIYDILDSIGNLRIAKFLDNPPSEKEMALKPLIVLYKAKQGEKGKKKVVEELATLYLGKGVEGGKRYARGAGSQVFLVEFGLKIPQDPKELTSPTIPMPGQTGAAPPGITTSPAATPEEDEQE